jgi:vancomycin resistance protein VanW
VVSLTKFLPPALLSFCRRERVTGRRPGAQENRSDLVNNRLTLVLFGLPVILAGACYTTYPFSDEITRKTLSTSSLSAIQKSNIELAARSINGTVLRPGEEFSFNGVVGPRSEKRGYRLAPSYLGPENPATVGGGVCLMSSEVYQVALESGCDIEQRFPHLRTVRSVPPGLDAAVWYGQVDLRFKNTLEYPVQLSTSWTNSTITVSLLGKKPAGYQPAQLERIIKAHTGRELVVELLRRQYGKQVLVSRDHYIINGRS